jgi:hypothetical protein
VPGPRLPPGRTGPARRGVNLTTPPRVVNLRTAYFGNFSLALLSHTLRGVQDRTDTPSAPDGPSTTKSSFAAGRALVLLVVTSLVAMWIYVLYLAFVEGRQPPVDRIDDPAFAQGAEVRCAQALDEVDDLPLATESPTPEHRAGVLDEANAAFATMLGDLQDMVDLIPGADERARAEAWLADWRTFLSDRETYASALRADPDARMLVSEKPGKRRHITGWIDEFAKANRMPSCTSPTDA